MKITALVLAAWSVCLIGCAARRVPQDIPFVVGLPTGGSPFVLPMPEDDAGKTKELDQNYKKVLIRVMIQ